eukprot:maker-scaffold320_size207635-snap-gene-1.14 protein:Tk09315 transcript:maker-scaffold320_size207635-snap-gene-1.14-mRNA-1 annotation:"PREDICTED: formimidoyltransferase-cyclodeaminase-like"
MAQIIECVPNFSEGKDKKVIDAIAEAISKVTGVKLLDVDPGASTNRTVFTFVGGPDAVVEGALAGAKAAFKLIDMTKHTGEHPRMGALDVCPFIPVANVCVEECVEVSKRFGQRLAREVGVPVFLYGYASQKAYRKTMPQIRSGEYEALEAKLKDPQWAPDFGEAKFVPSWGGTVTGVRKFLIAYNVNMVSTKEQAHRIALNLREQGRSKDEPGRLKAVQGIGWWLAEHNIAQISLNLTDMDLTPMHIAYEEAKKDAQTLNLPVTGSEAVGLVPLKAMLDAADYYIEKEGLFIIEEDQKVHLAINRLGLSTLSPFNAKERIIEYCLERGDGPLVSQTVRAFIAGVGARTTAPGGGSVSATVGALGAALGAMVGKLSYGKRQWDHLDSPMRRIIPDVDQAFKQITDMIDADTSAFNDYMIALKMPKSTEDEIAARDKAIDQGLKKAVSVPYTLSCTINKIWPQMIELAELGNINCKSDLQVGAKCLDTAVYGAICNVRINLLDIQDPEYVADMEAKSKTELAASSKGYEAVIRELEQRSST